MTNLAKKTRLLILLLAVTAAAVFGQSGDQFPRSAILDEEAYSSLTRKAPLAARSYDRLPVAVSLKQYAPLPGDQSPYGTCVAWASAYAARTIMESVALDRLNQTETTRNAYSPVYIYRNIRPDDPDCMRGAQIYSALNLMRDSGAVKMLDIERTIDFRRVDMSHYKDSKRYPIAGYVTLFSRDDRIKPALIARTIKKSLSEGKPVIIGMNTPDSFFDARDIWMPRESPDYHYGGHAMCVVGYDDNRNGGAFEVINSWGRKWGNGGFIWIPYKTFAEFVIEGYEIIENLSFYSDIVKFNGFVRLEITDQDTAKPAAFTLSADNIYIAEEIYTEGTNFRFIIGARESAYVYAFMVTQPAGDRYFYSPVQLFPQPGISPLLNYSDSAIALPGEDTSLSFDKTAGTEYLITLYSKQALDLQAIMRRFEAGGGTLNSRLAKAVGDNFLHVIAYNENEAAFTAEPDDPRAVAAIVTALVHK